jgi:hypothetical protein
MKYDLRGAGSKWLVYAAADLPFDLAVNRPAYLCSKATRRVEAGTSNSPLAAANPAVGEL